ASALRPKTLIQRPLHWESSEHSNQRTVRGITSICDRRESFENFEDRSCKIYTRQQLVTGPHFAPDGDGRGRLQSSDEPDDTFSSFNKTADISVLMVDTSSETSSVVVNLAGTLLNARPVLVVSFKVLRITQPEQWTVLPQPPGSRECAHSITPPIVESASTCLQSELPLRFTATGFSDSFNTITGKSKALRKRCSDT